MKRIEAYHKDDFCNNEVEETEMAVDSISARYNLSLLLIAAQPKLNGV